MDLKKYTLKNSYHGSVELAYGEKTILLREGQTIVLTDEEMQTIPEHKKYLLEGFLTVNEIQKEVQKINKK